MTKLADSENRALANERARHLERARRELAQIISTATHMQMELGRDRLPFRDLSRHVTELDMRLAALGAIDRIVQILSGDDNEEERT